MRQSGRIIAKDLGRLATVGWLAQQPEDFRNRLGAIGRWKDFHAGQPFYAVGDPADALYGLESGIVEIGIPIAGGEIVSIYRAEPGFWFGDAAVLARSQRTITVTAVEVCRAFRIPGPTLNRHLVNNPSDWQYFYLLSLKNATLAASMVAELLSISPRARFARLLLRLSDAQGIVHLTQQELARYAGVSRSSFRRIFADLIESGVVRTEYRLIAIVDRARLKAVAMAEGSLNKP